MSTIKLLAGTTVRVAAGEYLAEPLIVDSNGPSDLGGLDSFAAHVVLEAGAALSLTAFVFAVGRASDKANDGTASGTAESAAYVTGGTANEAAKLSLVVDLAGEGAKFDLSGLYVTSGSGSADIEVKVNHMSADCTSRQNIKGIAAGEATGSFTGMVHVAPGARHTDASQRNQNLQLTDTAHVFTRPQLEIYADDVKCSHGATVGRLDEEAIYYMRQRGVSEAEARRMQIEGFAGEIIGHCPSEELREAISARAGDILGGI